MQSGKPNHSETFITYNPARKRFVTLSIGSEGDYGMSRTAGWNGGTTVYTDTVANDNELGRTILTRKSANALDFLIYGRQKAG
jgi:hypothetical protein